MAGPVWSYLVDGVSELNDHVNFIAQIPEWDNVQAQNPVWVPIDGGYPAFIYMQPQSGTYSILVNLIAPDLATWQTTKDLLTSILSVGFHTIAGQVRGMSAPKTLGLIVTQITFDFKSRTAVANCSAPVPVAS